MPTTVLHQPPYTHAHHTTANSLVQTIDTESTAQYSPLAVTDIENLIEEFLSDCELRLQSPRTLETRRVFFRNWLWFLHYRNYQVCGTTQIRQFLHYLAHGHEEPGGRFGNPNLTRPVRPVTVVDYYVCLRSFFDWLVVQNILLQTPFATIPKPQMRHEVKPPLSIAQFELLLEAAKDSPAPARNQAILALLLDTGCRASELVALRHKDLDLPNGRCRVLGKGDKYRTLFFGRRTRHLLQNYLDEKSALLANDDEMIGNPDSPLFESARGVEPFTRSGLLHLLKRLGKHAGFKDEVSVHALRRSFAVQMLRNGANVFSVQAMLGHTNLEMTRKYCALALTDTEAQHRQFSPMDCSSAMD